MTTHEPTLHLWRAQTARRSEPYCRRAPAPRLSAEELALLRLVAEGLPIDSVAARLGLSPRTVRRRMHGLCDRIGVTGTMQAVVWAAHHGLV